MTFFLTIHEKVSNYNKEHKANGNPHSWDDALLKARVELLIERHNSLDGVKPELLTKLITQVHDK